MKVSEINFALNAIAVLLVNGRAQDIAQYFAFPLPLYFEDRFVMVNDAQTIVESMAAYQASVIWRGITRARPNLLRLEDASSRRGIAVVQWDYLNDAGDLLSQSTTRYVFRRGDIDGDVKIEMVEYIQNGFPDIPEAVFPHSLT